VFADTLETYVPTYFERSWTGKLYKATYNKLLGRGEDDVFFSNVAVADFTGDGVPDILQFAGNNAYGQPREATPSHGQFLLLAGRTDGTLTDATALLPGVGGPQPGRLDAVMRHLAIGDVNGDGLPDFAGSLSYEDGRLIGAGNATNVAVQQRVYLSNGAGHWDVVELDNLTWGHAIEIDDFDGDGRDDVLTGGFTITDGHQGGTVLSRFPAGEAQSNTPLAIGGSTFQLADLDGDGRNEVISDWGQWNEEGQLTDGGFEVYPVVAGALGTGVRFSTYEVDHFEEGWEWNGDPANIAVYRDPDGHEHLRSSIDNIRSADLDGDGKEEIVGLRGRSEIGRRPDGKIDVNLSYDASTEVVFFGWNGATLVERAGMSVTGFAPALYGVHAYEFVDFNFDGHLDLVVPRWDAPGNAPMQVFLNDGAGRFRAIDGKLLPQDPEGGDEMVGVVIDINGDRIMDILVRTDGHSEAGPDWGKYSEAMYLGTTKFYTGPKYTDPALKGAAGFNEQYYLNTYADARKAVKNGTYDTGLDHYLARGENKGYFAFAVDTHVFGSGNADSITAREGEERLDGGLGKDTLRGGGSADEFVFSTKLGPANVDKIADFKPGQGDLILLEGDIFRKIGVSLSDGEFLAGKGATKGKDANDRIIYDTDTGRLYFDIDGSKAGGKAAIHFATLNGKPAIDAGDFLIV
jgi:hypothetical protein